MFRPHSSSILLVDQQQQLQDAYDHGAGLLSLEIDFTDFVYLLAKFPSVLRTPYIYQRRNIEDFAKLRSLFACLFGAIGDVAEEGSTDYNSHAESKL